MRTAFIIITAALIISCSDNKIKPSVDTSSNDTGNVPTQESWNSKIYFTNMGVTDAILYAEHIMVYNDRKVTLLEGVKIDFYDSGTVTSTLTSKRGRVNDITNDMYAIDNVVAKNDSGTVLETEELVWRNKDKKIVSDKFVTVTSPEEVIQGYGFESDKGLDNYTIFDITYITAGKSPVK